jgi:diacylglycerol kinase
MKNTNNSSFASWVKSFGFAFNGLRLVWNERNFRFHLIAAVGVCILGFLLDVSNSEWLILAITIGWVLSMEALNTALEHLADAVTEAPHPTIKKAKDVAAAAVLISAMAAVIIGCIIFVPKVLILLS